MILLLFYVHPQSKSVINFDAYTTAGLCTSKTFGASTAGSSITKTWWLTELLRSLPFHCFSRGRSTSPLLVYFKTFDHVWETKAHWIYCPSLAEISQLDRTLFVHFVCLVCSRTYCECFLALGMREHVKNKSANAQEEAGTRHQAHRWASCFGCVQVAVMISSLGHI